MTKIDWISFEDKKPEEGQEIMVLDCLGDVFKGSYYPKMMGLLLHKLTNSRFTHWYPFTPPVKKRWLPKDSERYFCFDSVKGLVQFSWGGGLYDNSKRELIGVFRTKEEALEMRDAMRYEMIDSDNWQEYLERFVK